MYSQHSGRIHGASIFPAKSVSSVGSMHENTGITALCIGCKSVKLLNCFQFNQLQLKTKLHGEATCTSLHCVFRALIMPPLDGGGGGRGHAVLSCNHTDLPVGLLGRPVGGQATARNAGRPTVKCELR